MAKKKWTDPAALCAAISVEVDKAAAELKVTDRLLKEAGFTSAGGMWGDAQWKQLLPTLVVSIAGASAADDIPDEDDEGYMQRPIAMSWPVQVHVYKAPFHKGWKIEDGEAPIDYEVGRYMRYSFKNVRRALAFIDALKNG